MALLRADTDRHEEVLMDLEADQEVDTAEASVATNPLLDGTVGVVAADTVLVQADHLLVTAQTLTTDLRAA